MCTSSGLLAQNNFCFWKWPGFQNLLHICSNQSPLALHAALTRHVARVSTWLGKASCIPCHTTLGDLIEISKD